MFKQVLEFIQSFEVMNSILNNEMARKFTYFYDTITINIADYAIVQIKVIANDITIDIRMINGKDNYKEHQILTKRITEIQQNRKFVDHRHEFSYVFQFNDFSQFTRSFSEIFAI